MAYSPPPPDEEPPPPPVGGGARWVIAIALVAATVGLAMAAAAFIDRDDPTAGATTTAPAADTTATTVPETTTTVPETTTTTAPETTTTTVPETTTTTAPETTTTTEPSTTTTEGGDAVVNARDGFLALLDSMPRDTLGGRDAREIADDVDQAMEAHGAGDVEETRNELEEIGNQIERVPDDDAGRQLVDGFIRLAEAMGFEVEFEE